MSKHPDAFTIGRFASPQATATRRAGANRIVNPDFEGNSLTGWTNSGFSVVSATGVTPNGTGNYCAQATASGTPNTAAVSTLTLATRLAVTAGNGLYAGLSFGAGEPSSTGANPTPNYLIVCLRFWTAVSGGSQVREVILYQAAINGNDRRLRSGYWRVGVPTSATHVELYIEMRHYGGASGTPGAGIVDEIFLANEVTETPTQLLDLLKHASEQKYSSFSGLKFSRAYQYGDKSASFTIYGAPEWLWDWMQNALLNYITIVFDARPGIWNGYVWALDGYINGVHYAVSVETLANVIFVPYGEPQRFLNGKDADSIAKWGRIEKYVTDGYDTRDEATRRLTRMLKVWKDPDMEDDFAEPNEDGKNYLRVTVLGPVATLSFVHGLYIPGTQKIEMSEAIATHQQSLLKKVRATGNVFLSGSYGGVDTIGVYVGPTRHSAVKTVNALDTLKHYLEIGGAEGLTLIAGCFGNRDFVLKTRATEVGYIFENGENGLVVKDGGGARMEKAMVTAGKLVRRPRPLATDLMNSYAGDQGRNPAVRFLSEVEYDAEGDVLKPSPLRLNTLERKMARNRTAGAPYPPKPSQS